MRKTAIAFIAAAAAGAVFAAYDPELPWKYDVSGRPAEKSASASASYSNFDSGVGQPVDSGLGTLEARVSWWFVSEPFTCDLSMPGLLLMLH